MAYEVCILLVLLSHYSLLPAITSLTPLLGHLFHVITKGIEHYTADRYLLIYIRKPNNAFLSLQPQKSVWTCLRGK